MVKRILLNLGIIQFIKICDKYPYVKSMCPMSYVVQEALEVDTVTPPGFLNHIGHRAHRFHIEECTLGAQMTVIL